MKLANAGGCRDRHCAHKAREIMSGPLVLWFEGPGNDRRWVYGFKVPEQAAAFKAWSEHCGMEARSLDCVGEPKSISKTFLVRKISPP